MIIGITSVTTQILLMREMSTIFQGNELSLGTILGVWLFWTGMGSLVLSKISVFKKFPLKKISLIQIMLTIILPLLLVLVRSVKQMLSLTPGEMVGYMPMLIISMIVLAPFCLLSGLLYTIACQWVDMIHSKGSFSITRVYVWEAVGSALGGVLASLLLIEFVPPFQILIILATINFMAALHNSNLNTFKTKSTQILWILLLPGLFLIAGFYYSPKMQSYCNHLLWRGYNLIRTTNTPYGNVTVTRIEEQISLFHNGVHLFSIPDQLTAEESVHYSLLQHKHPQQVLLIGGCVQASLAEVLKYPSLKLLYYVELDPTIVKYALEYGEKNKSSVITDSRINIKNIDARLFIKKTNKKFDLIILNLPPPYTAQLNRFYTIEFFHELNNILKKNGIISIALEGAANVISPELSDYLSMIQASIKQVFSETVMLPGETIRIFASQNKKYITADPDVLVQRLHKRKVETEFIREYYLPFQLSQERRDYLAEQIKSVPETKLNRDLHPLGYYYHTLLWSTAYMGGFKKIFRFVSEIEICQIILFFLIISFAIFVFKKNNPLTLSKWSVGFSIIGVGFSEISIEFILILTFQILHGYVYQMLAVLIAGYMTGLALGARASFLDQIKEKNFSDLFQKIQFFMFILPLLLILIINIFQNLKIFFTNTAFLALPFTLILILCGFSGGLQFALGNHLFFKYKGSVSKTAGFLYFIDLSGSAGGALITSAFFIPILGINNTLLILAILNLAGFILLKASFKNSNK